MALEQNSPLGRLLAIGLANRDKPRAIMMERLEDGGRHVIHDLERFLNTLGTIAAVAPLLGLLGTVAGIIHAFNGITATGLGDPRSLSGGIGEALINTAAGLAVAIPSLIAYRYLRGKVERLVIRMEKEAMKLVDALDERSDIATESDHEPASTESRRARDQPDQLDRCVAGVADFFHGLDHLQKGRADQCAATASKRYPQRCRGSHEPLVMTVTQKGATESTRAPDQHQLRDFTRRVAQRVGRIAAPSPFERMRGPLIKPW